MNKKYENRPVDLLDLFWNIIFSWRTVLAWMLAIALLMTGVAGLKYRASLNSYDAAVEEYEAARSGKTVQNTEAERKEISFTSEQQIQIQDAEALQRQIVKIRNYAKESIFMGIDSFAEHVLTMSFYVDSRYTFNFAKDNTKDYSDSLVGAYVDYVNSGAVAVALKDGLRMDTDAKYVEELLSADVTTNGNSCFSVRFIYRDDSVFEAASDIIEKTILEQQKGYEKQIGSHTIALISSVQSVINDRDTADGQAAVLNNLNNYRSQYSALTASMDEQQLAKVNDDISLEMLEPEEEQADIQKTIVEPVRPSFPCKYPVLGLMLGLFFACVWIALKQIFSNKLQHAQELVRYFDLNEIGVLHSSQEKHTGRLDQWLRSLRYRSRKKLDADTRLAIVCGNLELMCKKEGLTRVCLTGTELDQLRKTDEKVLNTISKRLSAAGVQVIFADNICYDMNAMRTANEVGAVVLVEQAQASIYQEIDKELMMLKQSEVSVIGAIGMEE